MAVAPRRFRRWAGWFARHRTRLLVGCWVVLVAVAAILRLWLLTLPYWYDEALTMHYVRQGFGRMLQLVLSDLHVPVYYTLLYGWIRVVGDSAVATGALSVLLSVAAAAAVYQLGRTWYDRRIGWLAAAVFWVSGSSTWYATETRMYSLLMLLAAVAGTLLWRWAQGSRRAAGWWVAVNVLALATHSLFIFLILAQVASLLVWLRRGDTRLDRRQVVRVLAALALAALPLLVLLYDDFTRWYLAQGNWFARTAEGITWEEWLVFLIQRPAFFFYSIFLVPRWWWNYPLFAALTIVLAAPLLRVAWVRPRTLRITARHLPAPTQGLLVLATLPLLLLVLFRVHVDRYVLATVPFWSLWLALGLHHLARRRWVPWVTVLGLAVLLAIEVRFIRLDLLRQPDFRWPEVARRLQQLQFSASEQAEVVLLNSYDWVPILWEHYRGPLPVVAFFPPSQAPDGDLERGMFSRIGVPTITAQNIREIRPLLAPYRTVWLVNTGAQRNADPDDLVQRYLQAACRPYHAEQVPQDFLSGHPYEIYEFGDCRWPPS